MNKEQQKKAGIVGGIVAAIGAALLLKRPPPPPPVCTPGQSKCVGLDLYVCSLDGQWELSQKNATECQVAPDTAILHGIVTDKNTRAPIKGIIVDCNGYSGVTEADGRFRIEDIVPGIYLVTFTDSYNSYLPGEMSVELNQGEIKDLGVVALMPVAQYGILQGFIIDSVTGAKIPWASVYIDGEYVTKSASNGGFSITKVPLGPHVVTIVANNYQTRDFSVEQTAFLERNFELQPVEPGPSWSPAEVTDVGANPTSVLVGQEVTIWVNCYVPYPTSEGDYCLQAYITANGVPILDEQRCFWHAGNPTVTTKWTPDTAGIYIIQAANKSVTVVVAESQVGQIYSPWGNVRTSQCTIPYYEPGQCPAWTCPCTETKLIWWQFWELFEPGLREVCTPKGSACPPYWGNEGAMLDALPAWYWTPGSRIISLDLSYWGPIHQFDRWYPKCPYCGQTFRVADEYPAHSLTAEEHLRLCLPLIEEHINTIHADWPHDVPKGGILWYSVPSNNYYNIAHVKRGSVKKPGTYNTNYGEITIPDWGDRVYVNIDTGEQSLKTYQEITGGA